MLHSAPPNVPCLFACVIVFSSVEYWLTYEDCQKRGKKCLENQMSVCVTGAAVGTTLCKWRITKNLRLPSRSSFAAPPPGDGGRGLGHHPGDLLRHPDGSGLQRPRHGWKPAGRDGYRGGGCHQPGAHLQGMSNPQAEPRTEDANETRNHHLSVWYDLFISGKCYFKNK